MPVALKMLLVRINGTTLKHGMRLAMGKVGTNDRKLTSLRSNGSRSNDLALLADADTGKKSVSRQASYGLWDFFLRWQSTN